MKIVTAEEMRTIDQAAAERGVPGRVLMENAGRAVVRAVLDLAEDSHGHAAVLVVAGKGNNGGDGLVVARHLANQGMLVTVCLMCGREDLQGDAEENLHAALGHVVEVEDGRDRQELLHAVLHSDIIVDAILGTGVRGEVTGPARDAIEAINDSEATVVAVDIPSGVDADTGAICGAAVWADVTVTFGLPKAGTVLYPGAARCGDLQVADICLPADLMIDPGLKTNLLTADLARACLPERTPDMHKGEAGRVLIVAGSRKYTGAAVLAVRGAMRAGAGLTFLAATREVADVMAAHWPECIRLVVAETEGGGLAEEAADEILAAARECEAVAIGPGLGRDESTRRLVARIVGEVEAPLVVDADGLNALSGQTEVLVARQGPTILTPHPGEMATLLGIDAAAVQADRLAVAREAAARFGAVAVLKGAGTVVARPDGEAWVNMTGNHGLAKGGSGDVLTGIIAGFVAGGAGVDEAALAGVYYHGVAAERASEGVDPRSIVATDVAENLGRALAEE